LTWRDSEDEVEGKEWTESYLAVEVGVGGVVGGASVGVLEDRVEEVNDESYERNVAFVGRTRDRIGVVVRIGREEEDTKSTTLGDSARDDRRSYAREQVRK